LRAGLELAIIHSADERHALFGLSELQTGARGSIARSV
jgi:hypothetical protein